MTKSRRPGSLVVGVAGYDRSVLQWLLFGPAHSGSITRLRAQASSRPTAILDVGCGTGVFAERSYDLLVGFVDLVPTQPLNRRPFFLDRCAVRSGYFLWSRTQPHSSTRNVPLDAMADAAFWSSMKPVDFDNLLLLINQGAANPGIGMLSRHKPVKLTYLSYLLYQRQQSLDIDGFHEIVVEALRS